MITFTLPFSAKPRPDAGEVVKRVVMSFSGVSASMNENGIGQATSYANSAFASNPVSPTETYKRLLGTDRIVDGAAASLNIRRTELGQRLASDCCTGGTIGSGCFRCCGHAQAVCG